MVRAGIVLEKYTESIYRIMKAYLCVTTEK